MHVFMKPHMKIKMFIDEYLEKGEKMNDLDEMGYECLPHDENDVVVPVEKDKKSNIAEVNESFNEAYGLTK